MAPIAARLRRFVPASPWPPTGMFPVCGAYSLGGFISRTTFPGLHPLQVQMTVDDTPRVIICGAGPVGTSNRVKTDDRVIYRA
jgi:hypothetical protein